VAVHAKTEKRKKRNWNSLGGQAGLADREPKKGGKSMGGKMLRPT